jgi:hypothetical protein
MPKKQKAVREMTTDEIAKMVFPRKALKELKRLANPQKTSSTSRKKSNS